MARLHAFILPARRGTVARVAGLATVERAVLALEQAGVERIGVCCEALLDPNLEARLGRRAVRADLAVADLPTWLAPDAALVVVSADVVFEPAAVRDLVEKRGTRAGIAAREAVSPGALAVFSPAEALALADRRSPRAVFDRIDELPSVGLGDVFCHVVTNDAEAVAAENEYIRRSERARSITARRARRLSLPVSRALLKAGVRAPHVRRLGLTFALLAAALFAERTYWLGVAGGLAYYVSMVLDWSEREMARVSLTQTVLGARLGSLSASLSYFLVIGGIVAGELRHEGLCGHLDDAAVAALASLAVLLLTGHLSAKLAGGDPRTFDEVIAALFSRGTRVRRLAGWGRRLITRPFIAHFIAFQALIGQLPALLTIWAYASVATAAVLIALLPALLSDHAAVPARATAAPERED